MEPLPDLGKYPDLKSDIILDYHKIMEELKSTHEDAESLYTTLLMNEARLLKMIIDAQRLVNRFTTIDIKYQQEVDEDQNQNKTSENNS